MKTNVRKKVEGRNKREREREKALKRIFTYMPHGYTHDHFENVYATVHQHDGVAVAVSLESNAKWVQFIF